MITATVVYMDGTKLVERVEDWRWEEEGRVLRLMDRSGPQVRTVIFVPMTNVRAVRLDDA